MFTKIWKCLFVFALLPFCGGCGSGDTSKTITVYSPHGKLKSETAQRFQAAHPGWKVEFIDLGGGEIPNRIKAEKNKPACDVWWGGAAGDFDNADKEGLLEPYSPEWSKNLPAQSKSSTGAWVATFLTPEVILFNPKKVAKHEVPTTWEGLLDEKWRGRIAIRDVRASATMKTIFSALILSEKKRTGNLEDGFEFLKKLDANTGAYAGTPNILNEMLERDGPLAITVWNLPDAQQLVAENRSFDYVIPTQTPVPVEPVALIKNAPNPEGAKLFYDFVNSPEELLILAKERFRTPARTDLPGEQLPPWIKALKITPMDVEWPELQKNSEQWMQRWDSEIKGRNSKK
jgi:iron(III) transport system substrate-binding protein